MKTLLMTLILSSSIAMQASAFYFPEVATGDGSTDWNEMFGNQKAREILNHSSAKEVKTKTLYGGEVFKGSSPAYLKSLTASFEFLTPPQIGSYVTNIGGLLAEQTGQVEKMGSKYSEIAPLIYYSNSVKANAEALAKGQLHGVVYTGAPVHKSFLSEIWETMQKKTSTPDGGVKGEYIDFMGQLGLN